MAGSLLKTALSALALAVTLSACNENDHDPAAVKTPAAVIKTLTVAPSLGQFFNTDVVLRNALTNQELGRQPLINGRASFTVPASVTSVIAEVQGDADARYFDEATGSSQPFPAGNSLRVAVNLIGNRTSVSITALTEAAVNYALSLSGGISSPANITAANLKIAQVFGVSNITRPVVLLGSPQDYMELLNTGDPKARDYALRLAALAQAARDRLDNNQQPALKMAQALAADLSDGALDNNEDGAAYRADALADNLKSALTTLVTTIAGNAATIGITPAQIEQLRQIANSLSSQIVVNLPPPVVHCDDNMKMLTLADLASFVGSYNVQILESVSPDENHVVKNTSLQLASNGMVTLDGQSANTVAVCENTRSGVRIGVLVQLDRNTTFGNAHVDFNDDKTVNGLDYTSPVTSSRFFNGLSDSQQTLTISPSLGRITHARVILRNARNGDELARGFTGLNGVVSLHIAKTVDTVVAEVSGSADASYFDEAKGEQPLPESVVMRVAAPVSDNSNVGVSVLTEAAVQRAADMAGGISNPANITSANKDVGDAMGISDITRPPTLIGSTADLNGLGATTADQYALQLAGLVQTAASHSTSTTPALELIPTLASDLKDTVIDGKSGDTPIADPPYPTTPSVFQADWQFGMTGIVNALTNEEVKNTLKTEVIDAVEVKDPVAGPIVDGGGVFGGDDKKPWKGQIFELPNPTHSQPDFSLYTPTATLFTDSIDIHDRDFSEGFPGFPNLTANFGLVYSGPLTVAQEGDYLFRIGSDDGSLLFIDNVLVINNAGDHGFWPVDGRIHLKAGVHTLRVEYYQGPPTHLGLQLWVITPGTGIPSILTPIIPVAMAQP